ncbi:MAG: DUF4401 domain-containing protein [Woeseiaceae bacterium]|nr:DUF4401 domain-containing protein [Woeseiaceae bacterium]
MTELRRFCESFNIAEADAHRALTEIRTEATSALAMPWYARLIIGFGAWVTALVAIALGGMILYGSGAETGISVAIMGAIYFGLGVWWLRTVERRVYVTHLGIAITAAGTAMIAAGVGIELEEVWVAALFSAMLTGVIIVATSQRSLQFLAALLTALLFIATLKIEDVPYFLDIAALAGPLGVLMLLRPMQRDTQPAAIVLLLLLPAFGIFGGMQTMIWQAGTGGGWFAKILYVVLFLGLVSVHWRHTITSGERIRLTIFAVAAVLIGVVLPPGGSAALVILMLAFVLGSRPLALLGVMLQVHYIWRFYYDMQVTLLVKSGVLVAVGAVLVGAWWLMQRSSQQEAAP